MAFQFFRSSSQNLPAMEIPELGLELAVQLPQEASGEVLSMIETSNLPGFGPPLHRHTYTEIFRVLEGRYLFEVNGQRFEASAGDVVSVPGGDAHAFVNITDRPARQLVLMLPGFDAQGFFLELGRILANGHPELDALNVFGKGWGVEFLGAPLSVECRKQQVI